MNGYFYNSKYVINQTKHHTNGDTFHEQRSTGRQHNVAPPIESDQCYINSYFLNLQVLSSPLCKKNMIILNCSN